MTLLHWLTDDRLRLVLLPGLVAGLAIVLSCACLSVVVVLKRLAFAGQGVSHSAFGGIGVAAALGLLSAGHAASWWAVPAVVIAFCLVAAFAMAAVRDRRAAADDTAIGVLLVVSMAVGAVLLKTSIDRGVVTQAAGFESLLFGQIMSVYPPDAALAVAASAAILALLWFLRRSLFFWAFDESAAPAFGLPAAALRYAFMALLAVAIVTAMKIVGVVLVTALIVLPGATALLLTDRLLPVFILASAVGVLGLLGGIAAGITFDLPVGASVVLVQCAAFLAARSVSTIRRALARAAPHNSQAPP